ncbi:hypothetical protein D9758_007642 [Tetrapyrgos nigripes]|uniref:alpha-1,2-Mannosidase n=1 Tax=Tetrapyrgos nigripes TaxID=182062 RepID=A0A8H5LK25_9AGAR|nr:hypothetical protein D9758_007642 [Tetrapyrgos nigripes]
MIGGRVLSVRFRWVLILGLVTFLLALYAYSFPPRRPEWSSIQEHIPPTWFGRPGGHETPDPKGPPASADSYIHPNPRPASPIVTDEEKRQAVVDAFKHAWGAYERHAMGYDEFHPISGSGHNLTYSGGGIGYTVVDAIDTMHIMGLKTEYETARAWIKDHLSFARKGAVSMFETTIRVLGGLLSAYHLTSDPLYLTLAEDLGSRLIHGFNTPIGLPVTHVDLVKPLVWQSSFHSVRLCPAEVGTLQLEFKYLAHLTGNETYWRKVEDVMEVLERNVLPNGLVTLDMEIMDGSFVGTDIRLGGKADSYYEYLLKQWLQTNRSEHFYKKMYAKAMAGIQDNMVFKTPNQKLTYTAELWGRRGVKGVIEWIPRPRQEHLTCFLAGSLMLGATTSGLAQGVKKASVPPRPEELTATGLRDWNTGAELLETCVKTHDTLTGLAAEAATFNTTADPHAGIHQKDWYIYGNTNQANYAPWDARYLLRPEILESLFLAYRLTGDLKYRNYAWDMFQAIEKNSKLPEGGYTTVLDVDWLPPRREDKQETFFLSETLKYLYLIFSDSTVLPLTDVVFNTEAHPLPIFDPKIKPRVH